ncbi:MAG: universal stress protein [Candidatus Bathyarchaeia archaeon]|jgi:nucleotide-binding universal stress UspA family protein
MKRRSRIAPESKLPHLLFKNVLVPTDGSQNSKRAIRIAAVIAKKSRARLFVIHVISTPVYHLYTRETSGLPVYLPTENRKTPSPFVGEYMDFEDREARKMVNEGVLLAKIHGVKATGQVIRHVPSIVEAIADFAVKKRVDLIVIGTRGLSGFKKLLLGSVTSGIVSHAHCEVLVVR